MNNDDPDYVPHTSGTPGRLDTYLVALFLLLIGMLSFILLDDCAPDHPRVVPQGENPYFFDD